MIYFKLKCRVSRTAHCCSLPAAYLICLVLAGLTLGTSAYAQSNPFTVYQTRGVGFQVPGPLVQAGDGNFYAAATQGGKNSSGSIFEITATGGVTVIYSFSANTNGKSNDGSGPQGGLLVGQDGALYGTTYSGGANGTGTVFRLTLDGQFTTLANFDAGSGGYKYGALVQDGSGNLYGTTFSGGSDTNGTVFKVTPAGRLTLLHGFGPVTNGMNFDGAGPMGGLAIDSSGNLYGTTSRAGANYGGTIFVIAPGGGFSTAYNFATPSTAQGGNVTGSSPHGPLVLAANGDLYGVSGGGANVTGTIFMFSAGGSLTTIHTFSDFDHTTGVNGDGFSPIGLTLGSDGNLYGAAGNGGANATGTIFRISPSGAFATVYSLGTDQASSAPPRLGSDGALYGGGSFGSGIVYQLEFTSTTPVNTGSNVTVASRQSSVTFSIINSAGTTTFTSTAPASIGTPPNGFTLCPSCPAFEIKTTANYTPPITVCLDVPASISQQTFFTIALLHGENGVLVDRTNKRVTNPDGTREVCGTVSSLSPFALVQAVPAQLQNIATRLNVLTGDNVLIGGFIPTGSVQKKVVIRGIGPSLKAFGITNALANPVLELHGPDGTTLATNDDWKDDASQTAQIEATGLAPTDDAESALIATLDPNKGYTAIVSGKNGGTGVGLAEVYDIDPAAASKLGNIATRGFVDKGDNVMIGGLIVGPASGSSTKVVVRGIGPSLTAAGVNGAVQDPTLELHDSDGTTIASNDDWQTDANAAQVQAANLAPKDPRESAIYTVLAPAAYTAILRGKNDATGVGSVEVYNVN